MSALDGWPAVEPWLCRRSRELVITRTWCTVTARKTTTAITTSWPLNTRSAARAIRIPEPNCSSLTLSAPESAERDATAGSTVSLSIPPGQATPPPPPRGDVPSFSLSLSSPNVGDPSRIAEFVPDRAAATPELYPKFPRKPSGNPVRFRFWDFQGAFFRRGHGVPALGGVATRPATQLCAHTSAGAR